MSKQTTQTSKGAFNPLEYGKKLKALYEDDKLLGTVTVPWGIVFTLWFFIRDDAVIEILKWLSFTVGFVAISSAIKHVLGGFLQEHFKLKTQKLNQQENERESDSIINKAQTDAQINKEIAETYYQMKTINRLAKSTNGTAIILLNRSLSYMKSEQGKIDSSVLEFYAETILDLNNELGKHVNRQELPFKEFVKDLFSDFSDTDYVPATIDNIPISSSLTPKDIEKMQENIKTVNPTSEEMADISHTQE